MRISEVVNEFNISADTLRYYEKAGILGPVGKNESGVREYSEMDINQIRFIKCMKATGLSIDAIKEYQDLANQGDSTKERRLQILLDQKESVLQKMKELEETLCYVEHKISLYKD